MAAETARLAKLSRPRLFDTVPRERLFALIDSARSHPVIWVEGPAGAGKTSLVASYVEARGVSAFWYQVDAGDADVATFFHYLRGLPVPGSETDLPAFSADHLDDVAGFARRFFRILFARCAAPALLVLDNVHEAALGSGFVCALGEAIRQVPEGVTLVLVSRWDPPPSFARFAVLKSIYRIGWPELRLTAAETGGIAGLEPGADDARIAALRQACDGWAAGLTLMLARRGDDNTLADSPTREATFDFLAAEVLEGADARTRTFLLKTWMLPRLTPAWANELTGDAAAGQILATLFRQNYFMERSHDTEHSYQYHALFRECLAARAREVFDGPDIAALLRRAAQLLERAGDLQDAFTLLLEAGASGECARIVLDNAPRLAAQGRLHTLRGWIDALPVTVRDDSPWLSYWAGVCDMSTRPARARSMFEAAVRSFDAGGDSRGCVKAVTGLIDSWYAEWSDFSPLDPWIARLLDLLDSGPPFSSTAERLQAMSTAMVALLYRQPRHPRLADLAAQSQALLEDDISPDEKVCAGTYLLNCYNWTGETVAARDVIAVVAPHVDDPAVTPLRRAWWLARLAYHHYITGEWRATADALDAAARIAADNGFTVPGNIVLLYETFHHLSEGDLAAAERSQARLAQNLSPGRRLDHAIAAYHRGWSALLAGDNDAALQHGERAAELAQRAGVPNIHGYFLLLVAVAAAARSDLTRAFAAWEKGHGCTDGARFPLFEFTAQLIRAHLSRLGGDGPGCRAALGTAMALGAAGDYANSLLWLPALMSPLCALALQWELEPDYVRRLIRRRGPPPPGQDALAWPWPLRLFTLGAFRVERHGETIHFSRKAQKRPMELLMALVALGGRDINAATLSAQLWPDAEGDAARAALGTTLYRLRHLLDVEEAVLLTDGKLSLNPHCVWVDAWAFERLARESGSGEVADDVHVFDLYRGHFLDREDEAPWMLAPRERLRARLVRCAERLGQQLEHAGKPEEAMAIYRRGIDLDMLAEPLYRRLMQCHHCHGSDAEAIEVYRHCRQALSVVLGARPGAETEALRQQLG